jgi:hypothetical protein
MKENANRVQANTELSNIPRLKQVFDALESEIMEMRGYSCRLSTHANSLIPMGVGINESDPQPKKDPNGIVEHFWEKVFELRNINTQMCETANHLDTIL